MGRLCQPYPNKSLNGQLGNTESLIKHIPVDKSGFLGGSPDNLMEHFTKIAKGLNYTKYIFKRYTEALFG